ncbi:MAG: DUF4276 family protein [Bacteroidetes bacterium]|nr:DUF4276 family protein [Bacteroidota bacterium]
MSSSVSSIPIDIAVEDDLSEAVIRKILPDKYVVGKRRNLKQGGSGHLKKSIRAYNKNAAKGMPITVLTDLDKPLTPARRYTTPVVIDSDAEKYRCAPTLIKKWLPVPIHHNLLFRVAVREVEAWVLADRDRFARFLDIEETSIPVDVDGIDDPKKCLTDLARKSCKRELREAIAPKKGSTAKYGKDYNGPLIQFVEDRGDPRAAMRNSPSLKRAIKAVENFQPEW